MPLDPEPAGPDHLADDTSVSVTPNVVLANPQVRKVLNWVVGLAAVILPVVTVVDARSNAFDLTDWTDPATAGTSVLAGLLALVVTVPNIPKR